MFSVCVHFFRSSVLAVSRFLVLCSGNMNVFETHSIAYEPLSGTLLFASQDTGSIAGVIGSPNSFRTILRGDGNGAAIDATSDKKLMYWYVATQYMEVFTRFEVKKKNGVIVGSQRMQLAGRGLFLSVWTMNKQNPTQLAAAVKPPGQDLTRFIQITTNRGTNFGKNAVC